MSADYDGETWWTREKACAALQSMSVDEATTRTYIRAGLNDPAANVRRKYIEATFAAKDQAVKADAFKTYRDESIDQIFTVPYSMFTGGLRKTMGQWAVENLSKEDLRPYVPRFFKALSDPKGNTLRGSQIVLASFGDETGRQLELLMETGDPLVRDHALETLHMMCVKGERSPRRVALVRKRLEAAIASDDSRRAAWAKKLLKELEDKK
jgi:hypothetical protein